LWSNCGQIDIDKKFKYIFYFSNLSDYNSGSQI